MITSTGSHLWSGTLLEVQVLRRAYLSIPYWLNRSPIETPNPFATFSILKRERFREPFSRSLT